jgi:hypothetical protein
MSDTSSLPDPPAAVPVADLLPATEPVAAAPRLNALAVAALILGVLLSPLAALFGHLAVGQIGRSAGRERGLVIAWVAVGLGYLWLAAGVIVAIGVVVVLGR